MAALPARMEQHVATVEAGGELDQKKKVRSTDEIEMEKTFKASMNPEKVRGYLDYQQKKWDAALKLAKAETKRKQTRNETVKIVERQKEYERKQKERAKLKR